MLDYTKIPGDSPYMRRMVKQYMEFGVEPDEMFLVALLSNDLKRAVHYADDYTKKLLPQWVEWLYCEAPKASWGSADDYKYWLLHTGIQGLIEGEDLIAMPWLMQDDVDGDEADLR